MRLAALLLAFPGFGNNGYFEYTCYFRHGSNATTASLAISWTNPNAGARNRRATNTFVSPSVRLRLAFGQHHKSNNVNH